MTAMTSSAFTEKDFQTVRDAFKPLEESARRRCTEPGEPELIRKAFEFASEAHKNFRRRSGDPYMVHSIAVARIVVDEIGLGCKSIVAALLHDVVNYSDYTLSDIRNLFGDKIASLVEGLLKIKTILDSGTPDGQDPESTQTEQFKRILLTLGDDVRVVLIKLADRLDSCRTIQYLSEHKREKILSDTMLIFIPLAHQLGLYAIKSELENIWLKYKEPAAYEEIESRIQANALEHDRDMDAFLSPIERSLERSGFHFSIKRRVKSPYSVWRKMRIKHVTFEEVFDLYAIRIIFDFQADPVKGMSEREQCFLIYSIIAGLYPDKKERMRDWIDDKAKPNGYEALHGTFLAPSGTWVEVQIRTRRMDDVAEKGIAAHWAYKKDGYSGTKDNEIEQWLSRIKEILASPGADSLKMLDIIPGYISSSDICVFTPKGKQIPLHHGATALDFAYQIHSEIGNTAIAAKVNRRLVSLDHVLRSGDTVEIITIESVQRSKKRRRIPSTDNKQ